MNSNDPNPASLRMQADQQELCQRIAERMPGDGTQEVQTGLHMYRATAPSQPLHAVCEPSLCVIAQGSKTVSMGDAVFRYDPANYLITTMGVPLTAQIVEASPEQPYLSMRLQLDPSVITSVMVESGHVPSKGDGNVKAIDVSSLDAELLDATLRLVRLVDKPNEFDVLAPLVTREIIYRLLTGAQGDRMRHLTRFGGHAHRMVQAIEAIRSNFDQPIRIEDLAKELSMSVSGFHVHFKTVTAMTPIQFQKQLRLQEARRLMLDDGLDAAQAGFQVGYEDASHFSREYKRHFGKPPMRDVEELRATAMAD
ncbi:AraC family transcriptional regulator [Bremerella sp. JC770]|uniref:AraC family transcriptional regulator n=1 Tax=Bremerella sp. JC770 TaxID=3232137 RepID=UPI0034590688